MLTDEALIFISVYCSVFKKCNDSHLNRETNSEVMCCRFNPEGSLLAAGLANGVTKVSCVNFDISEFILVFSIVLIIFFKQFSPPLTLALHNRPCNLVLVIYNFGAGKSNLF